ncbi:flap endonuclease 1-like [Eucalyptus grandis]|uniref:flap endonuclease 1-like n=1 Tax=Eucalyptus grandis TaxID=71139 RepID=UPI00192EA0D8|nr:flap endonuclease 1-like [Eucalyptus grandis]
MCVHLWYMALILLQVTQQHNEDCKRLLRLMDVPVVEAPSEAQAQCAALCKAGKVYAVASEDMDSLTSGAPIFLRHLMDPISRKVPVMEFEISKIPDNWPYSEARLLFKGPIVSTEEQPEIKWTAPNEEGLISFLGNENGFNIDRVTNVWLLPSVMCWR